MTAIALRYRVVTRVPRHMRDLGFVAYVEDAAHPNGDALSMSWHQSVDDADRVAACLNWRELARPPERTRTDMLKPLEG